MPPDIPPALLWGLRRYLSAPQASVLSWQRQPFAGGLSGSILEYWRLNLRRAGVQSTITLVYKRGAVVEGAFLAGAPQREALAYANLPGKTPVDMPTAVAFDTVSGELWLLPFPPAKHTSHWQADWDVADVQAALSDLARLHLAFWDRAGWLKQTWPWLSAPTAVRGTPAHTEHFHRTLAEGRQGLETLIAVSAYDRQLTPERLARLQALATHPEPLLQVLNAGPHTLLHGDAGFQNVLITQDGRQRLWYDWQLAAVGPPALDVITFLHPWAYPEAQPPLTLAGMVAFYLSALARRGQTLDPERFQRQLDAALLWRWLVQWAPLLGQYRQRLRPEVRQRLYHAFKQLHWPALERF